MAPFQKGSIGTSEVQISTTSFTPRNGVLLLSSPGNASGSIVYVGYSGVAASTGFELAPGASIFVPVAECSNLNLLYAIGSTTGLKLSVWAM